MTGRLIDSYAPRFDVTQTQVVMVDAQPTTVEAALHRLPLAVPAAAAIDALGVADRLAAGPAQLMGRGRHERVYGLLWRATPGHVAQLHPGDLEAFAAPGYVKVFWDIRVGAGAHDGAELVSTVRFIATDDHARAALLTAWGLVGAVATVLSKRALGTLRSYAEQHDELGIDGPTELRLVAS